MPVVEVEHVGDHLVGDAHLHAREESRRFGGELQGVTGLSSSGVGHLQKPRPLGADDRDLGEREQAVEEDEEQDERDVSEHCGCGARRAPGHRATSGEAGHPSCLIPRLSW